MKLTSEQVTKIEALVTCIEEEGQRSAVIKYNLRDIPAVGGFLSVLRSLGVELIIHRGLSPKDRKAFIQWMREKSAAENATPGE